MDMFGVVWAVWPGLVLKATCGTVYGATGAINAKLACHFHICDMAVWMTYLGHALHVSGSIGVQGALAEVGMVMRAMFGLALDGNACV